MENEKNLPECCKPNPNKKKTLLSGVLYGTIPHLGCILFVIASILGVTILTQVFKPLLMNRYFFYYLILLSFVFATISSILYLKKNKSLSLSGIKNNKTYLMIMFGTTIGVNLILFFLIFPFIANINNGVSAQDINSLSNLKISVDIPCPGHAPLISNELKTITGVKGSVFSYPNNFDVYYDSSITNKEKILDLAVFKEYPAKIISENSNANFVEQPNAITNSNSLIGKAIITNNVQEINMDMDSSGYSPNSFALKVGIPVKWNINVKELTGCNQEIILQSQNIRKTLKQGLNVIEFTPKEESVLTFACGMGMLKGSFLVTKTGVASQTDLQNVPIAKSSQGGCGCHG